MGNTAPRTAVLTGATSGIGGATATLLAREGFDVVVAGRTRTTTEATAERVRLAAPNRIIDAAWGDLTRQSDVHELADRILARHDRIDVLVNNAGANFPQRVLTEDGVEQTLAVDALAPILLTTLLLPALHAARGRVINVASGMLKTPDASRWTGPEPYSQMGAYAEAKAMLIVLTTRMAQEYPDIPMVSMTPGIVRTGLGRSTSGGLRLFLNLIKLMSKQPEDAARGLLDLIVAPELMAGAFYKRGKVDRPQAVRKLAVDAIYDAALLHIRNDRGT